MKLLVSVLFAIPSLSADKSRSLVSLPSPAMSDDQIRYGGFILYAIGIFYLFMSIREVCTNFFLPSIDSIVERYNIKPEVAGATILAIGGSAPEIFIMFFGTFLAGNNIGHSTILGSGAINGMLLVGLCGMSASSGVELQWWIVVRDSIFNITLLGLLILFTYNLNVNWYEGFVLLSVYALYAVFMYYNQIIERNVKKYLNLPYDGDDIEYHPLPERTFVIRRYSITDLLDFIPPQLNFKKGVLAKMVRNSQMQITRNRSEKAIEIRSRLKKFIYIILRAIEEKKRCLKQNRLERNVIKIFEDDDFNADDNVQQDIKQRIKKLETLQHQETQIPPHPIEVVASGSRIRKYALWPIIQLMKITVPNLKTNPSLWMLSFFSCLIWIGILNFLLVWWVLELGNALTIPEGVLGVIILAAGVSIPDLVNTILKTAEGGGEMALSGCLGSNIMNFSFGVGLPWFLHGVILGYPFVVKQETYSTQIVLICTLGVSYIFIGGFKWQLSKNLGFVMIFFYLLFLLLFLLFQFKKI
jgi:K+-dependent Na+/Ca+ exchanger-like protein